VWRGFEATLWEGVVDRLLAAALLIGLVLLGLVLIRRRLGRVLERQEFLHEFAERFGRYVAGGGQDEAVYIELTERVGRMQRELGPHGVMAMYRPPFAQFAFRDYQIVVNMLPDYRQAANDWVLQRSQAPQYAAAIRDVLVRYSGALKELEADVRTDLRNPLIWFREGVRAVLTSPVRLMTSLGILTPSLGATVIGSGLLRVGAGIIALITLLAALVQIMTGWDATVAMLDRWLQKP
jgi:hypothetical protein